MYIYIYVATLWSYLIHIWNKSTQITYFAKLKNRSCKVFHSTKLCRQHRRPTLTKALPDEVLLLRAKGQLVRSCEQQQGSFPRQKCFWQCQLPIAHWGDGGKHKLWQLIWLKQREHSLMKNQKYKFMCVQCIHIFILWSQTSLSMFRLLKSHTYYSILYIRAYF